MSACFNAAFGIQKDAGAYSQTPKFPSPKTANLPTLLTGQRAPLTESKGSWKGLPAGITGGWKVRTAPESCRIMETYGDTEETPECGVSTSPIMRYEPDDVQHLIRVSGVQPWNSKVLFQQRLEKIRLAENTPLRSMKVVDGLRKFTSKLGEVRSLDEFTFVKTLLCMLDQDCHVDFIDVVLESMDFKKSGTLSIGEWAQGLVGLFEGTQEEKEHAIFDFLDLDGDHYLSYEELKEYLKPFVKAMIPAEASVLEACLVQHCTDQVLRSIKSTTCRVVAPSNVGKYGSDMVSYEELFQWLSKNSRSDSLAQIIDTEVGHVGLQNLIDDYRI
jgi:Ca2+-binding EF-hand superfamily protein